MSPLAQATAAVLVVYHPESQAAARVTQLLACVGRVIVVDNAPQPHPALAALPAHARLLILRNANRGGLAGAYNRAIDALAGDDSLRQLMFLDEDSALDGLAEFLTDPDVQRLLAMPDSAAVAPAAVEAATGLRGKHLQFTSRWRLRHLPREVAGVVPVAFVINSRSVWRRAALRQLGPFDEGLAVDHVDTEYCLRARHAGLKVWLHGGHTFPHRIGERRAFRLLGVQMQAGGHSPARRYLIGRNTAWLLRRSLWREPGFSLLCLARLAYEGVGIVMAEPQRAAKLAALLRGIGVGLCARRLA